MLSKVREMDFYRKIPRDLTEASTHGSVLSIMAMIFMVTLFMLELWAFMATEYVSNVVVDPNMDSQLRINFNITVLDVPCEYATIDIVDVLGTRENNVTKNINKWQIDSSGVRRDFHGRNREQAEILHEDHHNLAQLHENGVHVVNLAESEFDQFLESHPHTFVDFYAPWCIWCQRLEPVWEAFAEEVEKQNLNVVVAKVNCVENSALCAKNQIRAFPMLKWFNKKEHLLPDYSSDRSVNAFVEFSKKHMSMEEQVKQMTPPQLEAHEATKKNHVVHPGCLMSGFLLVNRVPGNFHIEARSDYHNLNPFNSNLSHVVNWLSFGPMLNAKMTTRMKNLGTDKFSADAMTPMNENFYITSKLHQAFHHYINVVSTTVDAGKNSINPYQSIVGSKVKNNKNVLVYQMVQSSQVMQYSDDTIPEARFSYNLSPMSVTVTKKEKRFYEFITSICAVIGGTFTVVGLLSGFLSTIFKAKKI